MGRCRHTNFFVTACDRPLNRATDEESVAMLDDRFRMKVASEHKVPMSDLPQSANFNPDNYVVITVVAEPGAKPEDAPRARFFRGPEATAEFEFDVETVEQLQSEVAKYVEETLASDPNLIGIIIKADGSVLLGDIERVKEAVYWVPWAHRLKMLISVSGEGD